MNKKIVIPAVLIGIGIAAYFGKKYYDKKQAEKQAELDAKNVTNDVNTIVNTANSGNIILANPFANAAALLAFQKWVNATYKPTIALVEDGVWGTNSAAAYNTYKNAYAALAITPITPTSSQLVKGTPVYIKQDVTWYNYPESKSEYLKGTLKKSMNLTTPIGTFEQNDLNGFAKVILKNAKGYNVQNEQQTINGFCFIKKDKLFTSY